METLKNGFHYPVTVILTSDEQFGYAREPIIQRMPDGSIVCLTLTGGPTEPHKTNVVGVVRSEDDGKSWSRHTTLFQHSERACWAPEMYVEGDVVCVLVHTYNSECRYRELIVYQSFSYDSGKTWTEPKSLPSGSTNYCFRKRCVLKNGNWIFPVYWQECNAAWDWVKEPVEDSLSMKWPKRAGTVISTDQGKTYSLHGYLKAEFPLWENNIVELENGDLIMLMRAERSGFLYKSISHDGGYTWSEAEKTDIPNPNSKITLIRQENKILLFHNPNSNYQGVIFDMRKPLSLWISYDEMKSWGKKIVLCDEPMFYPHAFLDNEKRMVYLASENARTHFLMKIPYAELEKE